MSVNAESSPRRRSDRRSRGHGRLRRRLGVAGIADRVAVRRLPANGFGRDRGLAAAGTKDLPSPSAVQHAAAADAAASWRLTMQSAIIGAIATSRLNGQPARMGGRRVRSRAPIEWARTKCGSGMLAGSDLVSAPPRDRAGSRRSRRTWPLRRFCHLSARKALTAPVERDDGKAAGAQLGHDLEIFLDEFRATLQDADGALGGPSARLPPGDALSPMPSLVVTLTRPPGGGSDCRGWR